MRHAITILGILLAPHAFGQRLISVATTTNGVVSAPSTFWPSNAASAWSAWGLSGAGIPWHIGSGRFSPLTLGTGLNTNGGSLNAVGTTNFAGLSDVTTNGWSQGLPVAFQVDGKVGPTNVLTVSTQNVDVLVLTEPLSVSNGGTGTNSAAAALSNLGGQPLDADLTLLSAIGLRTNGWTQGQALAFQVDGSLAPTNVVSGTNSGSGFGPVDYIDFAKPGGGWVRVSFDDLNEMDLSAGDGGAAGGSSVSWTNLVDVPAGFADGTDDGGSGSSWTNLTDIPAAISALSTNNGAAVTNLNGTEIRSGTVAEDRIDAAIARDSEVAAAYQPLDADLTSLAGGTAMATAITNSVSVGAPLLVVGTTNVAAQLALNAPIASPALTGNPTAPTAAANDNDTSIATTAYVQAEEAALIASQLWQGTNANLTTLATLNGSALTNLNASELRSGTVPDARLSSAVALTNSPTIHAPTFQGTVTVAGTNAFVLGGEARTNWPTGGTWDGSAIASGTITNLTTESITYRGRRLFNPMNGDVWADGYGTISSAANYFNPLYGAALAAGTVSASGTQDHPSYASISSSASANSGYGYGGVNLYFEGSEIGTAIFYVVTTNNLVVKSGFQANVNAAAEAGNGAYCRIENGYIFGRVVLNDVVTTSSTSNQVAASTWYTTETEINSDATSATFRLYNDSGTLVWSDTITASLPTAYNRVTGFGVTAFQSTGATTALIYLDALGVQFNRKLTRYP